MGGSLLLGAHHVDLKFGNLTITPLITGNDTLPPFISDIAAATYATQTTISGLTDEPATTTLEYGLDAGYGEGKEGHIDLAKRHSLTLTDLAPATLYHYQLQSADPSGNIAVSEDFTFATGPAGTDPSAPVSDGFNSPSLGSQWSFVNPLGDGSLNMTGTQVSISIPAGVAHDLWTDGAFAPRLMQQVENSDFEAEVKFDSSVPERYQTQGILVEGDGGFIRFEFLGDGTGTRFFVAPVLWGNASTKVNRSIGGGAPLYLKVKRIRNTWAASYSFDGVNWTIGVSFPQEILVRSIGIYGGNAGSPAPEHTSLVDYFRVIEPN
jgi:hypothetical protein